VECVLEQAATYRDKTSISRAITVIENASENGGTGASWECHDALHKLGRLVDIGPSAVPAAAMSSCSGGFVHGLFTQYARDDSGYLLMIEVCSGLDGLDRVLCKHGYGHAAASTGTTADAIATCQKLIQSDTDSSGSGPAVDVPLDELCSDGAFMELAARASEGDGSALPARVDEYCQGLGGVWGWGCFRQLLPRSDDAVVLRVATTCDRLEGMVGEGCAVGVAESVVERYRRTGVAPEWCGLLGELEALCAERVAGVLGL
jgi:hypothetical protein